MESFEKVYPTIEEVCMVNKNPRCPECSTTFNSESNLNLHLAKTHRRTDAAGTVKRIYYCPIPTCSYHKTPHFKQMKMLKQHFAKVHSEKKYTCKTCNKGFPTEEMCSRHSEYCDVTFKCCDCDMFYGCYETLQTHSRRKKHHILQKQAYKPGGVILKVCFSEEILPHNKRLLLPKPSTSATIVTGNITLEQSCQTDKSDQNNQETQTLLAARMPQFTVETQTVGDYFKKKSDSNSSLKTAKTQTSTSDPKQAASSTMCTFGDFELNVEHNVERNSSSTQTMINDEHPFIYSPTVTHDSIHTDTSDLLSDALDSNFFNCNIETQTDFIFNDELFKYCDDYTSMWTQTCEELLLDEIGLNDTHTQTAFEDALKSVESQTVMSQSNKTFFGCRENLIHMETQTEGHFKQMLEEINA